MIIRTETLEMMEEDLSNIMDVDMEFVYERLDEFYNDSVDGVYLYYDKFNEQIESLVDEYVNLEDDYEIYIYHLGRHHEMPTELLPLKELLLTENTLSECLKTKNVAFKEKRGELELYFNGKLIDKNIVKYSDHYLLACRLGYFDEIDYCVNGFAFWHDIENTSDGYFRLLQEGPEFLQNLECFLEVDLTGEYKANTNYYGIVCNVPIEDVIFDGYENLTGKEKKVRFYICRCLEFLFYERCLKRTGDNSKLRIRDDQRLTVDKCILINENTMDCN